MFWLIGLFGKIRGYTTVIMIGSIILTGAFATIQTFRVKYHAEKSRKLQQDIVDLQQAVVLTERLQKANAKLQQERNHLLEELRNAEGSSTPLPDDVRTIINRMRKSE